MREDVVYPRRDAHEVLAEHIEKFRAAGQTWNNGKKVWGTIRETGCLLKAPLILPQRVNWMDPNMLMHACPIPTLRVVQGEFPEGETALTWEDSKSQGNFGQWFQGYIFCDGVAQGIRATGDQLSEYRGLVSEPRDWGFKGESLSHSALITMTVMGARAQDNEWHATGFVLGKETGPRCHARLVRCGIHNLAIGIQRIRCMGTVDESTWSENCNLAYHSEGCIDCESKYFHLRNTGDVETGRVHNDPTGHKLSGTIRKSRLNTGETPRMVIWG